MKIFVTGSSGYIGGSVAAGLLNAGHEVRGIVRTQDKAELLKAAGIEPVLGVLDDSELLAKQAQWADVTINTADSDHFTAIQSLIEAMADTGKTLIHTSGSSLVVDDALGEFEGQDIYPDDAPFELMIHRTPRMEIDRLVRVAGIRRGIRTSVICPTMVYGRGLGIKVDSDQVPKVRKKSASVGAGVYLGQGKNIWSNVHVNDLVDLYIRAMERAPSASFFFAENGESTLKDVAVAVANSLGYDGKVQSWKVDDAVAELGLWARVALGTNCRVRATNARKALGWDPSGASLADTVSNNQ